MSHIRVFGDASPSSGICDTAEIDRYSEMHLGYTRKLLGTRLHDKTLL